jgi:hypothetical protein
MSLRIESSRLAIVPKAAYLAVWLGHRYRNRLGVDIQTQKS